MTYDEIHPALRGAIGMYEGFRRLGYPPDDIFVGLQQGAVIVILKANGKEFVCTVGDMAITEDEFAQRWTATAMAFNSGGISADDADRIYAESMASTKSIELVQALVKKGMYPRLRLGPSYN